MSTYSKWPQTNIHICMCNAVSLVWGSLNQAQPNKTKKYNAVPQMCSCLITPHCSLRHNNVTATGVMALARALQHNKSLRELE